MKTLAFRRSSPRLKGFDYRGTYAYMITMNANGFQRIFLDTAFTDACIDDLYRSAERESFEVLAYCFMPDHVHLLVQGKEPRSDLRRFMKLFKQFTGYRFKRKSGAQMWQRSYHDHVVREEEELETIADYIWHNPVRAGLVDERTEYAHSGPRSRFVDRPKGLSLRDAYGRSSASGAWMR